MAAQPLQGKIAIVTGGSRGIGEDRANALVKQIIDADGQAIAVQADVGAVDGAKKIVDATVKAFGKIDIIVNNAGGALETMSRHWAAELGGKNITSNCINPGPIATDMALSVPPEVFDGFKQLIEQRGAIKRLGTTEDIATVTAFLAGPGGQLISCDVLSANGDLYMCVNTLVSFLVI
ncbi:putative short-chain dehydrogenase/reductase [Umbelopsis sp. PMI_123]|nr:putative short-chain dehydrogenase/reductase [Umbelopsis sp. PMI_123]